MDDLGSSEEDEEEESGMEEGDVEEGLAGENEEDRARDRNSEDDGVVMTFSSVKISEEVEKGRAVKNQIGLYVVLLVVCFSKYLHLLYFLFVCCLFLAVLSLVSFQLVCDVPFLSRGLKPHSSLLSQPFLC
jgi:hypothetical protein